MTCFLINSDVTGTVEMGHWSVCFDVRTLCKEAKRIICFELTLDLRTVIKRLAIDHFEIRKFEKHNGSH